MKNNKSLKNSRKKANPQAVILKDLRRANRRSMNENKNKSVTSTRDDNWRYTKDDYVTNEYCTANLTNQKRIIQNNKWSYSKIFSRR
jgi:citrate synthase